MFGDESIALAASLLREALEKESDPEVLAEIRLRLKEYDRKR